MISTNTTSNSVTAVAVLRKALLATSLVLVGCSEPSAPAPAGINLSTPPVLANALRIDDNALRPIVTLSNGQTIGMSKSSTGGWTGTTTVATNQSYTLNVTWVERYLDTDLPLATIEQDFDVVGNKHVLNISQDNYDTAIDNDNDGISNLNERQNNTDPYVKEAANDTGGTTGATTGTTTNGTTGGATGATTGTVTGGTTGATTGTTTGGATGATTGTTTGTVTGGTVTEGPTPTVLIPAIDPDDAPDIDGEVSLLNKRTFSGIWAEAVAVDIAGQPLEMGNFMMDVNNADHDPSEILRRWYAMHDGEYLYLLVMSDDVGLRHSDSDFTWADDSVELFLDGDNSKLQDYGDDNDIQVIMPLQQQGTTDPNNDEDGRFLLGAGHETASIDIKFATGIGVGIRGIRQARYEHDIYEIRVELDSVGISVNTPFGLELQINDDDDGEGRDGKWGWFHPPRGTSNVDFTFENPSIMGTVILQ